MDLETAFYIIGIVFMSVMLLLVITLLVAVLVIRSKITAINRHIEEKVEFVSNLFDKGGKVFARAKQKLDKRS
jgi:hypothetical protein